jgi:hypothetical protein
MSTRSTSKCLLLASVALIASLMSSERSAEARTVPGTMGMFPTAEINGVKHEDCIVPAQSGAVINTCAFNMSYFMPLPIDAPGKKSIRVTAEVSAPTGAPASAALNCTAWATDAASSTLVLAQGRTGTQNGVHSFTINSHPVPAGGRLNLYCVIPHRGKIHTIDYTP